MGRKTENGLVGQPGFGKISISSNTIATTQTNTDLILDPNGTGIVQAKNVVDVYGDGASLAGSLRLRNAASTFYTTFSSAALTANRTLTFPDSNGTANYFLQTNGSGVLSWAQAAISVADDTATAANYYPVFTTVSSDTTVTGFNRSSTKLQYTPSTGTLFATVGQFATIVGSTSASTNLVLRSTTNATKGQVYIDETTASSGTTSGALRVGGGVGIAGSLYVGAASVFSSTLSCSALTETSSITLKENIKPLTDALSSILQLNSKIYDRRDGSAKNEAGLIAEEVEKIIPYVVTKGENGEAKGINYTRLTAYLIESIKELKQEINELKSR
jgi:hypothetical protein